MGLWNSLPTRTHVFEMKRDCFFNEPFYACLGFCHRHATWKVGNVRAVAAFFFFNDYKVFHRSHLFLKPSLFENAVVCSLGHVLVESTRNRHRSGFGGMVELTVASFLPHLEPAVPFNHTNDLSHFHALYACGFCHGFADLDAAHDCIERFELRGDALGRGEVIDDDFGGL